MASFIDMKTLIHVGVELIVVTGITYWLNRKINGTELKVSEQQAQIKALEETVKRQSETIAKHNEILTDLISIVQTGGIARPQQARQPLPPSRPQQPPQQRPAPPSSTPRNIPPRGVLPVEQPDVAPEQLDQLLEQELHSLQMSGEGEDDGIEIECNGDVCLIKETPRTVSVPGTPTSSAKAKAKKKVVIKRNV